MAASDRLELKILAAEDLTLLDSQLPSAFVEVILGPNSKRTKPFPESTDPEWNNPAMIFDQIISSGVDALLLYVKHFDVFTGRDIILGSVVIPLATALNSPTIDIDDWYELVSAPGMTLKPQGRIHVILAYFNGTDDEISAAAGGGLIEATNAPNLLQIRVLDADFSSTSVVKGPVEAFVIAQVGDLRKQSQVSKKSLTPSWNETIELPVVNGTEIIEITVKQTQLIRSLFIGRIRIPMNEVAASGEIGLKKEYALLNENFEFLERGSGNLNLNMKWIYDQTTEETSKLTANKAGTGILSSLAARIFRQSTTTLPITAKDQKSGVLNPLLGEDDEDEDEDTADMTPQELTQYLEEKRKKRTEEIEKFLEKTPDYEETVVKEGDYTIQVHIIEVSDIKGYNASGLSDPFCVLEVFGQKQKTRFIRETSQCFFDETFYFNLKDVKREQLAEGTLKITVYDHNWLRSNDMIGYFQVDLQTIYNSPDHEMYRRWAALRNPSIKDDLGSQGNVKFSCCVLGPGDAQKVHDPSKEEDDDEKDLELKEGVLQPDVGDGLTQTLQFLVISIIKADGLPGYDRLISSVKNGLYAYVKLEFAGLKPIKTSKVFVTGKKNLSVTFEEELWIPVWTPTMCRKAKLTIYNREFGRKDLLIATAYIEFDGITKLDSDPIITTGTFSRKKYDGPAFEWVHLFGANPLVRGSTQAANFMNRFPNYGSAYRGSLLIGKRLLKYSNGSNLAHVSSMNYDIPESLLPKQSSYLFRVLIYQGSDFGSRGQQARGKEGSYALGISIGPHEIRSAFRTYVNGSVDWTQVIELPNVPLPSELDQVPDTIITVYKGSESSYTSVAFSRLNTVELLLKMLRTDAMWYELKHDQSHKSNSTLGYPGAALLKIALVNMNDVDNPPDWETERKKLENKKPYVLRIFIYQAKGLPAVDDNGMIDPYIKARFCGQKKKTQVRNRTLNPTYYEVLSFDVMLPQDLTLAPNILLQVWDSNTFSNAPIAALRYRVADVTLYKTFLVQPQTPQWRELYGIDGKGSMGEILCSFQLFEKKSLDQVVPQPEPIVPSLRKAFIDVHVVGLRDLTKSGKGRNVKKPYLQFDVASQSYGESFQFGASRTPSASNPNYLDRHMSMISLPEDPMFTPTLEVKVFDERISGSVLLGVASISLLSKLPWNGDEYIPPRQHMILEENIKQQKAMAKKRAQKKVESRILTPQQGSLTAAEMSGAEDDDNEAPVARRVVDTGLGVFPVDDTAREPGSKYAELPKIMDDDEMKLELQKKEALKALRKKQRKARRHGTTGDDDDIDPDSALDGSNLAVLDGTENLDDLKRIVGIPTTWTSTDFLTGREWWTNSKGPGAGGNLENYLETYPFENYDVYHGHIAFNKFGKRKETKQKTGLLKAVIRICVRNPLYDDEYNKFAKSIKNVTTCVIRLYVVKVTNLQPVGYFSSKADPYCKVILGNKEEKDLKTMNKKTLAPEFYSCYEFTTTIPGPSTLKLQIFDHRKFFGSDVLMGETVIDCEDRFFHPKWTALGDTKPVEARNLYKVGSQTSQGVATVWLDILTATEAQNMPPVKLAGPEKLKFEIRVICWRSKEVSGKSGLKDLFGIFYMEGDGQARFQTDTHWRCKGGNASWNWRMKIPIELPIKARELGRLHIQLWDHNIITSNEIIGESTYNLYDWLVLAYHRKNPVFPFKELKAARQRMKLGLPTFAGTADPNAFGLNLNLASDPNNTAGDDSDLENGSDDMEMNDIYDSTPLLPGENPSGLSKRKGDKNATATATALTTDGTDPKALTDKDGKVIVSNDLKKDKIEDKPATDEEDEQSEAMKLVDQINIFLGIGDSVADDAEWINLTHHDRKNNKIHSRGKLAVSICIVPESETLSRPVGTGRDEPNVNPYLPPPFGRFSFSFNPFYLINGLCGPKILCAFICVCSCMIVAVAFLFLGSYLSGIESAIELTT